MPSEDDLLAEALRGNEEALAELLERYGPDARGHLSIAQKWRSVVDEDDVMQVTYLEAFLRIQDFSPAGPGSFSAWLRRIAENNLRDAIKELQRFKRPHPDLRVEQPNERSYVAFVDRLSDAGSTPSRAAAGREAARWVEDAVRKLPPDYQRVVRLFELEGRSGPEVAEQMGRSHGAVKMLLARSRDRLRELLGSQSRFFSDTP